MRAQFIKMTILCNLLRVCYVNVNNIEVYCVILRFSHKKRRKATNALENDKICQKLIKYAIFIKKREIVSTLSTGYARLLCAFYSLFCIIWCFGGKNAPVYFLLS